jgi:hypothetical protein
MSKERRRKLWLELINVTGALCGITSLVFTLKVNGTLSGVVSLMMSSTISHF